MTGCPTALLLWLALAAPPASSPELALLATSPQGETTELYFQRAGAPRLSSPVARFSHPPGATVHGSVVPHSRVVLAIAQLLPAREPSWASGLLRLEPGKPPVLLADRVYHSTRPLITSTGRVFVQRGRAGAEPTLEQAGEGRLRIDALTIDEVHPRTGESRTVHSFLGYITFLAGAWEGELILYRVSFQRADLVAVHADTGAVRPLGEVAPFGRDFSVDAARGILVFSNYQRAIGQWEVLRLNLRSLHTESLARGPSMALAPRAWPDGKISFNPGGAEGLTVLGEPSLVNAPLGRGVDFLQAFTADGAWAVGLHTVQGELPVPFALRTDTGRPTPVAAPAGRRIDLAGVIEARR